MKKRYKTLYIIITMLFLITPVHAQENTPIGISFEGDAKQFVLFQGDKSESAFVEMMPGETRTQQFIVRNDSFEKMKFYVRADQTDMLNTDGSSKRIVYDIDFKNEGATFFSGRVGTKENLGKENLKENYLLKTLAKGESTTIDMAITIDGTSMDNTYQGNVGDLGLVFHVETDTGNPIIEVVKKIPVVNQIPGVITGDTTALFGIAAVVVLSGMTILVLVCKRRKKEEEDEKA